MKKNRVKNIVHIDNKLIVDDAKPNVVMFGKPLVITSTATHHSGIKYDLDNMNIDAWNGKITADHESKIDRIVGNAIGLERTKNKVTIAGIDFASDQNPYALLTRNMMVAGYVSDASIETLGTYPNEEGVIEESDLVGLSLVVQGNNPDAHLNTLIANSIQQAKDKGLETDEIESEFEVEPVQPTAEPEPVVENDVLSKSNERNTMFVTVKNSRSFAVSVTYKNASNESVSIKLEPGQSIDVSESQAEMLQAVIANAQEPSKVEAELAEIKTMFNDLSKQMANSGASEPEFSEGEPATPAKMTTRETLKKQVDAYFGNDSQTLREINKQQIADYKAKGLITNTMSIEDFGSLVLPSEIITEIQRADTDFKPLLNTFGFKSIDALEFLWGYADGDIDMQPVDLCDGDLATDGLKPITEYEVLRGVGQLAEFAGVTPVCDSATRHLAVDALLDIASAYRRDYDRKLSQLVIARLQQAVDVTGNKTTYTISSTDPSKALESWIESRREVIATAPNGVWVLSHSSLEELRLAFLKAGVMGGNISAFTNQAVEAALGRPMVVVPDELLPSLKTNDTRSFTVNRSSDRSIVDTVTIDQAVFYADPAKWVGRTSGGLKYDLSNSAAYEVVDGETITVKSAFQRNQTVLRGSALRGGDMLLKSAVSSLTAATLS